MGGHCRRGIERTPTSPVIADTLSEFFTLTQRRGKWEAVG